MSYFQVVYIVETFELILLRTNKIQIGGTIMSHPFSFFSTRIVTVSDAIVVRGR